MSVEQHVAYITDGIANQTCKDVLEWLTSLDPNQVRTHGLKYRVSVKYKGNNFVDIHTRRNYSLISWRPSWGDRKRIAVKDDFTEEIRQQLQEAFVEMGGLPPDVDESISEEDE